MGLFKKEQTWAVVSRDSGIPLMIGFKSRKEAQERIHPQDDTLVALRIKNDWKKKHFLEKLM